jgi:hypothetical protein
MWLPRVALWGCNNVVMTCPNPQRMVNELPLPWTVDFGISLINIICHIGVVTLLPCCHFQMLSSCITSLHSTWHTVCNQPAGQAKDIKIMGHSVKNMTFTRACVVDLKCSRLPQFPGQVLSTHGAPGGPPRPLEMNRDNWL